MNEDEIALIKAIESGDSDLGNPDLRTTQNDDLLVAKSFYMLVYLVLFRMKRRLPIADFFRIINGKVMACNLLEAFCKQQDRQLLKDFYYQDDRRTDSANVVFLESYEAGVSTGMPNFNSSGEPDELTCAYNQGYQCSDKCPQDCPQSVSGW